MTSQRPSLAQYTTPLYHRACPALSTTQHGTWSTKKGCGIVCLTVNFTCLTSSKYGIAIFATYKAPINFLVFNLFQVRKIEQPKYIYLVSVDSRISRSAHRIVLIRYVYKLRKEWITEQYITLSLASRELHSLLARESVSKEMTARSVTLQPLSSRHYSGGRQHAPLIVQCLLCSRKTPF